MKLWIVLVLVAVLGSLATAGTDVGQLRPVEVLWVRTEQGKVCLRTDLTDVGSGENVEAATADLKQRASGEVFPETAEYLLINEKDQDLLAELIPELRPSCMVCLVRGEVDLQQVGAYLRAHPPQRTLAQYQAGEGLEEILEISEGSMKLCTVGR